MTQKPTQNNLLLSHFKAGGSITSYEAFIQFGITQLSAGLGELEAQGHFFHKTKEKRNGKNYIRYRLVRE